MVDFDDLAGLARIPIAELNPSIDGNGVFVEGFVTLIWPFSASKRSYSVLLADPDFRLRQHNGQVRIHFMGASAKAVAECTIKYGDRVFLKLQGVQWERDQAPSSTPGRSVVWELQFDQCVSLQIQRESQKPIILHVDRPAPSVEPLVYSPVAPPFPAAATLPQAWSSPAFLKRRNLLPTLVSGSEFDPFGVDDFEDNDRAKKIKFGRASDQWTFVEKSPSPAVRAETEALDLNNTIASHAENSLSDGGTPERESQRPWTDDLNLIVTPHAGTSLTGDPIIGGAQVQAKEEPTATLPDGLKQDDEVCSTAPATTDGVDLHTSPQPSTIEPIDEQAALAPGQDEAPGSIESSLDMHSGRTGLENLSTAVGHGDKTFDVIQSKVPHLLESQREVPPNDSISFPHANLGRIANLEEGEDTGQIKFRLGISIDDGDSSAFSLTDGVSRSAGIRNDKSEHLMRLDSLEMRNGRASPRVDHVYELQIGQEHPNPISIDQAENESRDSPHPLAPNQSKGDSGHETTNPDSTSVLKPNAENSSLNSHPELYASTTDTSRLEMDQTSLDRREHQSETDKPFSQVYENQAFTGDAQDIIPPSAQKSEQRRSLALGELPRDLQDPIEIENCVTDDEDQEWNSEEERAFIEQEEKRLAGEEFLVQEGDAERKDWSSEEESFDVTESVESFTDEEAVEDEEWSVEESDYPSEEEAEESESEGQPRIQDTDDLSRPSAPAKQEVDIITIDDSDDADELEDSDGENAEEEDGRLDSVALSTLLEMRHHALSHPPESIEDVESPGLSSPHPFPSTIPDSQAPVLGMDAERWEATEGVRPIETPKDLSIEIHSGIEQDSGEKFLYPELPSIDVDPDTGISKDVAVSESVLLSQESSTEEVQIDPRLKNQVLTPNETQSRDQLSQSLTISPEQAQDTHDLPTPRLTQSRSSDVLLPATLRPSSPLVEEVVSAAVSEKSSPRILEEPWEPEQRPRISPKLTPKPLTAVSEILPTFEIPQKPELKLCASPKITPKSRRISSIHVAVSPWFAPRQSTHIIPDSRSPSPAEARAGETSQSSQDIEEDEVDQEDTVTLGFPKRISSPPKSYISSSPSSVAEIQIAPPIGLRTSYSYFAPLSTLSSHFNTTISTISIVISATSVARAITGPKDHYNSIFLTDPSSFSTSLSSEKQNPSPQQNSPSFTTARIFRPSSSALPSVTAGDVLLLRSFAVQSYERRPGLVSINSSAWAVFRRGADVQMNGPPVEFGAEERGYARGLWGWWEQVAEVGKEELVMTVQGKVERLERREKRDRKKGRRLKGMGLRLAPELRGGKGKGERETAIHELRDGKAWVDDVRKVKEKKNAKQKERHDEGIGVELK